jgi:hypothetical protein
MDEPTVYQIRVRGHLDESWAVWFEGLTIANLVDGEAVLSGSFPDQAALHGILKRISSLGISLVSVNAVSEQD